MSFSRPYIVLELPEWARTTPTTATGKPSLASAFQSRAIRPGASHPGGPADAKPGFRTEILSEKEAAELKKNPVLVAAPIMALKLIAPVTRAKAKATASSSTQPLWGLQMVGAARPDQFTGQGVTVAVLDTGIDRKHEAFKRFNPDTLIERDFTTSGNGDRDGHGTHCAGTIFGGPVGGQRIGVAPGVDRVLIGKVLGNGATTHSLTRALFWALSEEAHVISMSLGADFPGLAQGLQAMGMDPAMATSKALEGYRDNLRLFDALAATVRHASVLGHASVLIAATGNESDRRQGLDHTIAVAPPAVGDGIVAVGAIDEKNSIAWFSNTGPTLVAPGVEILSADIGGGLTAMSGTSMATPHVAGVAALWIESMKQQGTPISTDALTRTLTGSAMPLGPSVADFGRGLVQAPP